MTHSSSFLRRRDLIALGAAGLVGLHLSARAQSATPLKIMVGFAAGGSADQLARLLGVELARQLDRTVIVDNRVGAGGRIAVEAVKAAKPDGNTLMLVPHGPMTMFPHTYRQLRYDPVSDFTPIGRVCSFDFVFVTGPGTSATTMAQYMAWARDPAHHATYGTPGAGTVPELLGKALAQATNLPLDPVGYKGMSPAVLALIAGDISMAISLPLEIRQFVTAGKLRALATSGEKRTPMLPEVPTLKESGVDLALSGWYGLYAPRGLPAAVQEQLADALRKTVAATSDKIDQTGLVAAFGTPAELALQQQAESAFWKKLVADSGIQPQE